MMMAIKVIDGWTLTVDFMSFGARMLTMLSWMTRLMTRLRMPMKKPAVSATAVQAM